MKTKRLSVSMNIILSRSLAGLVFIITIYLCACGSNSDSSSASLEDGPLTEWKGKWISQYALLQDSLMTPAFEAVAEYAPDYSAEDIRQFYSDICYTDFAEIVIDDNTITYLDFDGETVLASNRYKSAGYQSVALRGELIVWNKFEPVSESGSTNDYSFIMLADPHTHDGDEAHWHMRYGNTLFEILIDGSNYFNWWPSMNSPQISVQELAIDMYNNAQFYAQSLPPISISE